MGSKSVALALSAPALLLLPAGGGAATALAHPGMREIAHPSRNVQYSSNWSGYAVTGGSYNRVSAAWIQPAGKCSSESTYAAFWVGLDGYSSSTVEQTGSEVDCVRGKPRYYAWYEMYPANSVDLRQTVAAGDAMSASVTASGAAFTLTVTDSTQKWTATEKRTLASAQKSSAEIIAEAPCCTATGGILPLTDFGTVHFTAVDVGGKAIGGQNPVAIDIGTASNPIDATSAITKGTNYSVTYTAAIASTSGGGATTGTPRR